MHKVVRILLVFSFFLLFVPKTFAASSFSSDYNVTYNIQGSSDTLVNLNVVLTNLTTNYYASSYSVEVGFKDIRNITASDSEGAITPKIETVDGGSKIDVPFNEKVTGLGKKLSFKVSFVTREVASDLNSVWDVNIPGISSQNDFANFNVNVIYPSFLGKPTFIKPSIPGALANATANSIKFTKEDLGYSGISLAFGKFQAYDFNLTYHLENTNVFKTNTEIALPPSTNYQDISISQIFPKPTNVYLDKDGNWLAKYTLAPSTKLNIKVTGQAKIYLNPKAQGLTSEDAKIYLAKQDFWETQNPKITTLAKTLKTPKEIYDYVVKTLKYDFSRVESNSPRLGAIQTLNSPSSAVCLEFTDLFVTLARAAGIPARGVNGYAYTDNASQRPLSLIKDVLHAWPEYYDYDKKTWIMVDPTWGNTTNGVDYFDTLDFDHFTFTVNGVKSNYPVPAGGYKFEKDLNSKDVDVEISKAYKPVDYDLKPQINMTTSIIAGLPIKGSVTIQNDGGTIFPANSMSVFTGILTPSSQNYEISQIPPYGSIEVPIYFNKTSFLTKQADTIRIAVGNKNVYQNVFVVPLFLNVQFLLGGVLVVIILLTISAGYYGYRNLPFFKRRRESNLLRESDKPQKTGI